MAQAFRFPAVLANALPYALLIAAVFAAYANVYDNAFLYDDLTLIVDNRFLRSWRSLSTALFSTTIAGSNVETHYYRPLQILLYSVIFQKAGLSPAAFHLVNVALHALVACLVFTLGVKLRFNRKAVFLAAVLWAVHPVQTEAVAYISATADPLYSLFCVLGVLVLLPDFSAKRIALSLPLMLLALLSKESAVVFPLLAMSAYYFASDRRFAPKSYVRFWPLLLLSAAYVLWHYRYFPVTTGAPSSSGALFQAADQGGLYGAIGTLISYVKFLALPLNLHMGHDLPAYATPWNANVIGSIGLFILCVFLVIREPTPRSLPFRWGLCWFAAALVPAIQVKDLYYEHWLYLPSAGLFLGAAQSLALMFKNRPWIKGWLAVLSLSAALLFGFLTLRQNLVWRDPVVFYETIIANEKNTAYAHNNLGGIYFLRGDKGKAVQEFRLALQKSNGQLAEAHRNLANALLSEKSWKTHAHEAIGHLNAALKIKPRFYLALDDLATLYGRLGDKKKEALTREQAEAVKRQIQNPLSPPAKQTPP